MAKPGSAAARDIRRNGRASRPPDVSGLERLITEYESGDLNPYASLRRFMDRFPPELAKVRRQAGLQPVPINGSVLQGAAQGYFQMPLRDGTTGFFQRRTDDCIQAVFASLLQMPPYLVPDLRLDEQTAAGKEPEEIDRAIDEKFAEWGARYGVRIFSHATPPTWSKRWIGIIASPSGNPLNDHTLLMSGSDCLFDPAHLLPPEEDQPTALAGYTVADIDYGMTIEKR